MDNRAMSSSLILVVEDDPMQSKLASFLLEEAGHAVQIAESAERALDVLHWLVPDLILMDIELPGKDGLELTRELRGVPAHANTPIVAFTAYTDGPDVARAREAGCSGVISKPIDTAALVRQVGNYLEGGNAGGPDVRSDSGDLLAEMRNAFLAEGMEQCGTILKNLKENPGRGIERAQRVLGRWAKMGSTLGFPEISKQAQRAEVLLSAASPLFSRVPQAAGSQPDAMIRFIETVRRRFFAAARHKPSLPTAVIGGLRDVRIGLANFSEEEVERIRRAAIRSNVRVTMDPIIAESAENQNAYGAVIVNECGLSADAAQGRMQWTIPALFIGSRSSLEALSRLPSRAQDFLIAPWDAEEVLLHVHGLLARAAPAQPPRDSVRMPRRRPRVVIADDDPDLVALVSATLEAYGMECEIARSGLEALRAVRRGLPDAVILDVNMVDLDGFEVLKQLRQSLATIAIPVLLLTARTQESDIARGVGYGAADYVIKPFDSSDLVGRVDRIIASSSKPLVAR